MQQSYGQGQRCFRKSKAVEDAIAMNIGVRAHGVEVERAVFRRAADPRRPDKVLQILII